ncbi:MAG: diaminopimelate epimerase [Candidatus Methanofastidiosia archaeon]
MKFIKMEGLGNDYIYVDLFEESLGNIDLNALSKRLSDRHFGIGSDGLVIIGPSDAADCKMRMFNSDGSESEMCGNAVRCVAKIMYDKGIHSDGAITVETLAGIIRTKIIENSSQLAVVEVIMGVPCLNAKDIPTTLDVEKIVAYPIKIGDETLYMTCVSMGNPHCVIFVDEITDSMVHDLGSMIETNPVFQDRCNVEFVKILDRSNMEMRVWERGAGETLACGTGASAALVAGVLNHLTDRHAKISLLGGTIDVSWLEDGNIKMVGPAVMVFKGEIVL